MRRLMFLSILGLALIGATSVSADPQPQPISQGLQDGQPFTIQGSGFGSKSSPTPFIYADFEDGTPGQSVNESGFTTYSHYGGDLPVYSTDHARAGGHIATKQGPRNNSSLEAVSLNGLPGGELYVSGWFYGTSDSHSYSHKFIQINDGNWGPPYIKTGGDTYYRNKFQNCPLNTVSVPEEDGVPNPMNNGWHRWEWYLKIGSSGVWKTWRDGDLVSSQTGNFTLSGCQVNSVYLSSYYGAGNGVPTDLTAWQYWDEVYIDKTQARVEIGDASTFGACTHREVQIPSAWNQNSISFTVNAGSFSEDANVYLYVIDQDGAFNHNGVPVSLGGGGGGGDNPPVVQILTPVPGGNDYPIPDSVSTLVITGTANDDLGIAEITWSNDLTSDSGQVSNQSGDWRSWELEGISLETGVNTIEIRVRDSSNQFATETITVTRDWEYPAKPEQPRIP